MQLLLILLVISFISYAQEKNTIARQLGYPEDAKLLIIHADDAGLSHSVNMATISAFEKEGITSASVMVPCPWFYEFAEYAKSHRDLDIGVHLTFSCEWKYFKWDGVLPSSEIPSLINDKGYFAGQGKVNEIKAEAHAQIQRAIDFGVNVTHIDTHVGTMFKSPELVKAYFELGKEFSLPVLMYPYKYESLPEDVKAIAGNQLILAKGISVHRKELGWEGSYKKAMEELQPGLNILIIHLAYDNPEMQAVCGGKANYGAAWRQKDYDYIVSKEFKKELKESHIYPVTWKKVWNAIKNE